MVGQSDRGVGVSHTSGIAGQRESGGTVRQRGGGESHLRNSRGLRRERGSV